MTMAAKTPDADQELPDTDANPYEAIAGSEPSAEDAIRALQALVESKDAEIASLKDQALRALAEVENNRRRFEREQADTAKYAITNFARDLVQVLENLQRACDAVPQDARSEHAMLASIATGVEMTLKDLLNSFEKHGIIRLDPMGEKFDHNLHQAVSQQPSAEAPAGTVIQVLQAGYKIHDRLLRPAMVVVASEATDAAPGDMVDTRA